VVAGGKNMKKLKLKKGTKFIQYKKKEWKNIFDFLHNNESDFVKYTVEPEGDLMLGTERYGFRVKENHWLLIIEKKLYRIDDDLFRFLFKNFSHLQKW